MFYLNSSISCQAGHEPCFTHIYESSSSLVLCNLASHRWLRVLNSLWGAASQIEDSTRTRNKSGYPISQPATGLLSRVDYVSKWLEVVSKFNRPEVIHQCSSRLCVFRKLRGELWRPSGGTRTFIKVSQATFSLGMVEHTLLSISHLCRAVSNYGFCLNNRSSHINAHTVRRN